jgi:uroporphyrinogen-III synthase
VVTATSVELLVNLRELLGSGGHGRLRATPLVVASVRMAGAARDMGVSRIIQAAGASNAALLEALCGLVEDV